LTVATAVAEDVIVNSCVIRSDPSSVPVNEEPGVTDETHDLVALEPFAHETSPWFVVAVFATEINAGFPGANVASDVARLLADGPTGETVAVLENAAVEPLAFAAVTRQRMGLEYPRLKKLDGGVYVDKLLVPGALT
jgi:hypothetical protein